MTTGNVKGLTHSDFPSDNYLKTLPLSAAFQPLSANCFGSLSSLLFASFAGAAGSCFQLKGYDKHIVSYLPSTETAKLATS